MTAQTNFFTRQRAPYIAGAALALASSMIAGFEGLRLRAYRDPVGILTVCYGHTGADIDAGKKYSRAECEQLLQRDIEKHAAALACIKTPLTENQKAAFVSFAFNVGKGKFCKSTLVKKANAGDMAGACAELSRWVYGNQGGVMVKLPGLVKRRAAERAVCETPDSSPADTERASHD